MSTSYTPENPGAELLSIPQIGRLIDMSMQIYDFAMQKPSNPEVIPGTLTKINPAAGMVSFSTGRRAAGDYPQLGIYPHDLGQSYKSGDVVPGVTLSREDAISGVHTTGSLVIDRNGRQDVLFERFVYKWSGRRLIRTVIGTEPSSPAEEGQLMELNLVELHRRAGLGPRRGLLGLFQRHAA